MNRKRAVSLFLTVLILLGTSRLAFASRTVYEGEDFRLEKEGRDVYVSMLNPLLEGGYKWERVYRIKNVLEVREPINYKINFDAGAGVSGTDEFPFLLIDGALDIESLVDDIYFDVNLYDRLGSKYRSSGRVFYMDGYAKYLLVDKDGESRDLKIETGQIEKKKEEWTKEEKTFYLAGYEKGGRIYSRDGRLDYKGESKTYYNYLLRGENWRSQKDLPRIFIKSSKEKEVVLPNAKFKDVSKKSWYANYVGKLVELGGVEGFGDGNFRPNQKIRMGEFLKMAMSSATGKDYPNSTDSHWAMLVYDEAVDQGIISMRDFPRKKETLNSYISREDMAYIIVNIDEKIGNNQAIDVKGREKEIEDYYKIDNKRREEVLQAYAKGFIRGRDRGFDPKGSTTRAEATAVVVRLLGL